MVTPRLDIRSNITDCIAKLRTNRTDQIPFATAVALTRTAQRTQVFLSGRIPEVFDRPTPYTEKSLYVRPATKTKQVASVYIKDEAPKGTPASKYLQPNIDGGTRSLKRSESALRSAGILPAGMMIVPGAGAQIDQYGNMKASQIIAILAAVKALRGEAYTNAAHVKRRRRGKYRDNRYFVAGRASHLPPGIYERIDERRVKPVMVFVKSVYYTPRWPYVTEGLRYAGAIFNEEFTAAFKYALATAR